MDLVNLGAGRAISEWITSRWIAASLDLHIFQGDSPADDARQFGSREEVFLLNGIDDSQNNVHIILKFTFLNNVLIFR